MWVLPCLQGVTKGYRTFLKFSRKIEILKGNAVGIFLGIYNVFGNFKNNQHFLGMYNVIYTTCSNSLYTRVNPPDDPFQKPSVHQ